MPYLPLPPLPPRRAIRALALSAAPLAACLVPSIVSAGPAQIPDSLGLDQKVLVIPMKHVGPHCPDGLMCWGADDLAAILPPRHTAAEYEKILNDLVNDYYLRVSWDQTSFEFDVLENPDSKDGWWDCPSTVEDYINGQGAFNGNPGFVRDGIEVIGANAEDAGLVDLSKYTRVLTIANVQKRNGQSTGPNQMVKYDVNGRDEFFTAMWVWEDANDVALTSIVTHELGHQLGVSDLYGSCGPKNGQGQPNNPGDECVGGWELMGFDGLFLHPGGWTKVEFDWLPEVSGRVTTTAPLVSASSGYQTYVLDPIEVPGHNLLRIPLVNNGSKFIGFQIDCRKPVDGDDLLVDDGVVITLVDETLSSFFGDRPLRILRSLELEPDWWNFNLSAAALEPGQAFVEDFVGLSIFYEGDVGKACQVGIENHGVWAPDIAVAAPTQYKTPDLWVDSPKNGVGLYPPDQPLDADGVPSGEGDPAWVNHQNQVGFRVRNIGLDTAYDVQVEVLVRQPISIPTILCDVSLPGPATSLGTVIIPKLDPGEVYVGAFPWTPSSDEQARVELIVDPVDGELSLSNNEATETVKFFQPIVCSGDICLPGGFDGWFDLHYPCIDKPGEIVAGPGYVPPGWDVMVDPGSIWTQPGGVAHLRYRVSFPRDLRPGQVTEIPIAFSQSSFDYGKGSEQPAGQGDAYREAGGMMLRIAPARASALQAYAPASVRLGSAFEVTGSLDPGQSGARLALEYTSPSGRKSLRYATTERGRFADRVSLSEAGRWQVQAFWQGDLANAMSESTRVQVDVTR